jgi:hypothetical protein
VALVAAASVNCIIAAFTIARLLGRELDTSTVVLLCVSAVGVLLAVGVPLWVARAALRGSFGAAFWSIFLLVTLIFLTTQGDPWGYIGCLLALASMVLLWMPASREFSRLGGLPSRR